MNVPLDLDELSEDQYGSLEDIIHPTVRDYGDCEH
jgi:hypothetical protein